LPIEPVLNRSSWPRGTDVQLDWRVAATTAYSVAEAASAPLILARRSPSHKVGCVRQVGYLPDHHSASQRWDFRCGCQALRVDLSHRFAPTLAPLQAMLGSSAAAARMRTSSGRRLIFGVSWARLPTVVHRVVPRQDWGFRRVASGQFVS